MYIYRVCVFVFVFVHAHSRTYNSVYSCLKNGS